MFLLVFVVLLGTAVTVNSDHREVEMFSKIVDVGAEIGSHMHLTCRVSGFNTSDIILNMKRNHCVLTEEDKVETSGVKPHQDTFWRTDHVIILKSEVSNYSCEVVHAASRFRVEKVWDPDSDGGGRNISSKFIDTNQPHVLMFTENSEVHTNVTVTCLVSGFYPNNITLNMKRNGRILTREDGVKSSGVCSYEDDTFQRRDSVEIKTSDTSNFSCEVIHDASGSQVEKFWDHHLPHSGGVAVIIGPVVGVLVLVLVVVLVVLKKKGILGTAANEAPVNYTSAKPAAPSAPPPGGNDVNDLPLDGQPVKNGSIPVSANGNALTNAELNGNVQHHINTPSGPSSSEQETPE